MIKSIMAVVALTESAAEKLFSEGKNVYLLNDDTSVIFDIETMKKIKILRPQNEFLNELDVVEYFYDKGLYKLFDSTNEDNAIVTSNKCNSNCVMCPYCDNYRATAQYITPKSIIRLIDAISLYPKHLTVTGGEPTLIGDSMFEIMDRLKCRFPLTEYLFLTNGRIFSVDEYYKNFLDSAPHNIRFAIPIYGNDENTHDAITRTPGSFIQAVKGIQNLMNSGQAIEIRIVVSKLNYKNLNNIVKFISEYLFNACVVNFVGLEMCGNAARNRDRVWVDYKETFSYIKEAADILLSNGIDVGLYNFPLCTVDIEYRSLCKRSISGYKVTFYDECDQCSLKSICGGIFRSTYLLEHPGVQPIGLYD